MKTKIIFASALMALLAAPVMAEVPSASNKPLTSATGETSAPSYMSADEKKRWEEQNLCAERERRADGTCKRGVQRSPATGPNKPPGPGAVTPGYTSPPGAIGGPGNSGGSQ